VIAVKKIINQLTLRAGIATALCISFLIFPPLRVSSAGAAARVTADLKSESQFRSEASRYDGAIRAMSGIVTMKLETGEDLKKALAILDREGPNLKLHFSKFVVLALSDSTFANAVKKKLPDKQAADAFAKELKSDPKAVLKLDGAESLTSRIQRSAESDAAVLRRAGERLKEAAERIKKAGQRSAAPGFGVTDEFRVIQAGFSAATEPVDAHHTLAMTAQRRGGDLSNRFVRVLIVVVPIIVRAAEQAIADILRPFEEEDVDQVTACQERAEARHLTCVSEANALPSGPLFFQREVAIGLCYSQLLAEQAACLVLII
jgi:hypothetical protein